MCLVLLFSIYFFQNNKKSADNVSVQARWADDLVDSIGMNTHLASSSYNYQKSDLQKDKSKPLITMKFLNNQSNIDYSNARVGSNTFLDFMGINQHLKNEGRTKYVYNQISDLIRESGIRHIRDNLDNVGLFGFKNQYEKLYDLQNQTEENKNIYADLLIEKNRSEDRFYYFCKGGKYLSARLGDSNGENFLFNEYVHDECNADITPAEASQIAQECVAENVKLLTRGGTIPKCMIILDQYYKRYFEDSCNNKTDGTGCPLKDGVLDETYSPITLDSVEGFNEWDFIRNEIDGNDGSSEYISKAVKVRENTGRGEGTIEKIYYFTNWYNALAQKHTNIESAYNYLEQYYNNLKSDLGAESNATKLLMPSLSYLYYYDIPYQKQLVGRNSDRIQIVNINTESEINEAVNECQNKNQSDVDMCLENKLRENSVDRSIYFKNKLEQIFNSSNIANQHYYCKEDWPLRCATDHIFDQSGNQVNQNYLPKKYSYMDMGVDKILTQYLRGQKPLFITEWNYPSYYLVNNYQKINISGIPGQQDWLKSEYRGKLEEVVQNKYLQKGIFDNFDKGIARSYIYEFYNEGITGAWFKYVMLDPKNDIKYLSPTGQELDCMEKDIENEHCERHKQNSDYLGFTFIDELSEQHNFGIVRNDFTKKPSFYSIKNITSILSDPLHNESNKNTTPGSLTLGYSNRNDNVPDITTLANSFKSVTGDQNKVNKTLLQKHDGRYYLVFRNNSAGLIDHNKAQELIKDVVSPISVTIAEDIRNVKIYDPGNYYTNDLESSYGQDGKLKPIFDSQNPIYANNSSGYAYIKNTSTFGDITKLDLNVPDRDLIIEITTESVTGPDISVSDQRSYPNRALPISVSVAGGESASFSYLWSKVSGPGNITFENNSNGSKDAIVKADTIGDYVMSISVTNGSNHTTTKTLALNVHKLGDINDDDRVNSEDFFVLLGEWGKPDSNNMANINGIEGVDSADFFALLSLWGS